MDRLNEAQQVAICKLSWHRLAIGLIRMGLDEDEVDTMSEESLREAWAHMVTHGRDTPSEGGSSETISARALRLSEELQPERLPLKKLLYEEREREKERERAERNEREEKEERERETGMEEKKEKEERRRKEEDERRKDAEERAERKARESRDEREREETQKREEEERKRREEETMRREEEEAKEEEGKKREEERRRKEEKEDYIPYGPEISTNGDWQTALPSEKELKDQDALMPYSKADGISRAAVAPSLLPGPNKVDQSLKVRTLTTDQLAVGQQSETQLKPHYDSQKREEHYFCVKADVLKCKDRVVKHRFELIAFNKATDKVEDQIQGLCYRTIKHYNENSESNVKLRLIGDARGVTVLGSSFPWSPGGVRCSIAMGCPRMADTRTCGFIQSIKHFHPWIFLLEINGLSPHHQCLKEIAQRNTKLVRWARGKLKFPILWKYRPDICHLAVDFLVRQ